MRMIRMQKVWKKIGAFVLALALVVPLLCGSQMTVKADSTPVEVSDLLTLKVEKEGCSRYTSDSQVGLQKGDYVTVSLVASQTIRNLTQVGGIVSYDTTKFKQLDVGKVSTDLAGWTASCYGPTGKFMVYKVGNGGVTIPQGTVIFRAKLVVAYDVESTTTIQLEGYGSQLGIDLQTAADYYYHTPVSVALTNSQTAERKLSLSVVGNNEAGDGLLVSKNFLENQKAQIAIKVDPKSQYNGFKIACTYNPLMIQPYDDKEYELSSAAQAYVNAVEYNSVSNSTTSRTDYITVLASENINLDGEFLYLNFRWANTGLTGDTKVKVQLYGASNDSGTTMTYGITGGTQEQITDPSYLYNQGLTTLHTVDAPYKEISVTFVERMVDYGDINGDNKVDLIDATMVLQYYNGVKKDLTAEQLRKADVDQSGSVNLVDVLFIMKFYNGAITSFPAKL
ncbi:MAG: dockerin type I repeat-containing protein [Agathobacter sp.]|nr:dockerin type I repeat-containing protein [Agathobacter sp.]